MAMRICSHWRRLLSAHVDRTAISLVVDLGCGTGRFSELLAAEFDAWVVGLDRSEKMIDQARRKPATTPVVFGRAAADKLPLADGRVDLPPTSDAPLRCCKEQRRTSCVSTRANRGSAI